VNPNLRFTSEYDVWFYLIVFVTLAIVPVMILWWIFVLRHLNRRSQAGVKATASRWHFLRYGPMAPLLSAAVLLCGLPFWDFFPASDTIPSSIGLCLMVMTVSGFVALVISVVLWSFTRVLERSITDSN
jgi:heme/copper-type cytochrome/quinol oxidase subunit 2